MKSPTDGGAHIAPDARNERQPSPREFRCPDGSWSKHMTRHCKLPMGHSGPHDYEIHDLTAVVKAGMKIAVEPQEYGGLRFVR